MDVHRRVLILSVTLVTYFCLVTCDCNSSEVIELIGAGSSLTADMYQQLGDIYSTNRSVDRTVNFTFFKSNSVDGKNRIMLIPPYHSPIVYAASEDPLSPEERTKYPELLIFPIIAGAVAIVFNLPQTKKLNLTAASLPEIFMGNIQYWNDPAIQSANPLVSLPHEKIQPIVRADPAGNTVIFTSTLASVSPTWNKTYGILSDPYFVSGVCCNSTAWPKAVKTFGNHAYGLAGMVASIPYTIGYAPMLNTIEAANTYASIINRWGVLVEPNTEGTQAAMEHFFHNASKTLPEGLQYDISNAMDPDAYPFVSFSYMILNRTTHQNISQCQMEELTGYVAYLFTPAAKRIIQKNSLVPLSTSVKKFIVDALFPMIKYGNKQVYKEFLASLIHPLLTPLILHIIVGLSVLITVIVIGLSLAALYFRKYKMGNLNQWVLSDVELMPMDENSSTLTMMTTTDSSSGIIKLSMESLFMKGRFAKTDELVYLTRYFTKKTSNHHHIHHHLHWKKHTKTLFTKYLREFNHQNLIPFVGIANIEPNVYIANQYTILKGPLHQVLQTCPFHITDDVKINLSADVLDGIMYLHRKNIPHGRITSLTCYLDPVWCVKIGNWEFAAVYASENNEPDNSFLMSKALGNAPLDDDSELITLLYRSPDYANLFHSDVYSYGVLLYEIFTRQLPYFNEVSAGLTCYPEVLRDKFTRKKFSPPIKSFCVHPTIENIIDKILSFDPGAHDVKKVQKLLKPLITNKKSVIDTMMQSMESYMFQLEEKVSERTSDLTGLTRKMKQLLDNVLPKQISTKLFQGEVVEPEYYESCTVLFSDIIGYTAISAKSTPTQVMMFLNEIYTMFDKTLESYDVYKVFTVGDKYMVASGLPMRNGINHCKNIGMLALDLMKIGKEFQISHLPDLKLKLKMGINSGPVTAGVIGSKMPQYCIFGDTVTVASKLEKMSEPNRIQVSLASRLLFVEHFPKFCFSYRGEINIQGKGKMSTYWLDGV